MSKEDVLNLLAGGRITIEEASQLLAALDPLCCKVSPKGAISVYGLQQMPVTLYADQWERLLAFGDQLRAFVQEWEGKDYRGEHAAERGGKKVPYTARIARKAAAPRPCPAFATGPRSVPVSTAPAIACARRPSTRIDGNEPFRWGLRAKSFLGWILAPLLAVVRS